MYEEEEEKEEHGLTVPSRVKEPPPIPPLFSVVCGTYYRKDLWNLSADLLLMVTNDSFMPPFWVIPFVKMLS